MKTFLLSAILILTFGAGQAIFAQKNDCVLEAWITDKDPKGLNVRDKPSVKGKVLATLKSTEDDEIIVRVVGYSNGWVKISGTEEVSGKRDFSGIGWVSAKMIGTGTKGDGDYEAPAPIYEKPDKSSKKIGSIPSETTITQIVGYDCFGLQVIYKGKIGWLSTNNICGNPISNCS